MKSIQMLIKPASGNCNLRCEYCFYYDEMKNRDIENYGFMTVDTLETLVKKTLGSVTESCGFAFQGGEPTLIGIDFFYKLIEFQEKYNVNHVTIHNAIQTNGVTIDETWASFFSKHHFLVGISVDGVIHTHNKYRVDAKSKGSFEQVMKAITYLDQFKVDYNILTVINAQTAQKIKKIYEFYKKNQWNYLQFISCLDPIGEEPGKKPYSLTPKIYGEFLIQVFELWYLDLQKNHQPYIREFENYVGILMGGEPEACNQKGHCSIQCVIEADGSVYPCDFYVNDEYHIGNVCEHTLEEIMENGKNCGFVQESLVVDENCKSCNYYYICRGGCRRTRDVLEDGSLGSQYFCEAYKMFFEKNLPRLKQIAAHLRNQRPF